jgi:transposase
MGAGCAVHAVAKPAGSSAHDGFAGGDERDPLHCDDRVPIVARQGIRRMPERGGQLPKDFPPYSTVQRYFYDWRDSGLLQTIRFALAMEARELEGREASPSAGVIDSQSVKTTESGGVCGFDAGKKVNGRKRHIVVDTIGLMFGLVVHAADIQDRDGAPAVLKSIRHACPWLRHVFADGGYAGPKLRGALDKMGDWTLEIVKRSDMAKGFEILPRRWVVERTFAWLGRCRRLAKDWEKSIASSEAWINIAHIRLTTRRLARYCYV